MADDDYPALETPPTGQALNSVTPEYPGLTETSQTQTPAPPVTPVTPSPVKIPPKPGVLDNWDFLPESWKNFAANVGDVMYDNYQPASGEVSPRGDTGSKSFIDDAADSFFKNARAIGEGGARAPFQAVHEGIQLYKEMSIPGAIKSIGERPTDVLYGAKDAAVELRDQLGGGVIDKYADAFMNRRGLDDSQQGGHGAWVDGKKDHSSVPGALYRAAKQDPFGVAMDFAAAKDILGGGLKKVGGWVEEAGDLKAAKAWKDFEPKVYGVGNEEALASIDRQSATHTESLKKYEQDVEHLREIGQDIRDKIAEDGAYSSGAGEPKPPGNPTDDSFDEHSYSKDQEEFKRRMGDREGPPGGRGWQPEADDGIPHGEMPDDGIEREHGENEDWEPPQPSYEDLKPSRFTLDDLKRLANEDWPGATPREDMQIKDLQRDLRAKIDRLDPAPRGDLEKVLEGRRTHVSSLPPAQIEEIPEIAANRLQSAGRGIRDAGKLIQDFDKALPQKLSDTALKGIYKAGGDFSDAKLIPNWLKESPFGQKLLGEKPWLQAFGAENPAERRLVNETYGAQTARKLYAVNYDRSSLLPMFSDMSEEVRRSIGEYAVMGEDASERTLERLKNPVIRKAYDAYKAYIDDCEAFFRESGAIDPEMLENRVVRQHASEMNKGLPLTQEMMDESRARIGEMTDKPIYVPAKGEGNWGLDQILPQASEDGTVSRMMGYKGKFRVSRDPQDFIPKVISSFRDIESKWRTMELIADDPKLAKPVTDLEDAAQRPFKAKREPNLYDTFFENKDRAQSAYRRELQDAGAEESLATNSDVAQKMADVTRLVPNPTVRRILEMHMRSWTGTPKMLLNWIDGINGFFKTGATRYNPHFYAGKATADAVYSALAGVTPGDIAMGNRLKDVMGYDALKSSSIMNDGRIGRYQKVFDGTMELSAAAKRGVISKELAGKLSDMGVAKAHLEQAMSEILENAQALPEARIQRFRTGLQNAEIPEMAKSAKLVSQAEQHAKAFFGDYTGLGPTEQYVMRRIFPFYPMAKAMTKLAATLPIIAPKMSVFFRSMADLYEKQNRSDFMPGAMHHYGPLWASKDENGNPVTTYLDPSSLNPLRDVRKSSFLGVPVPGALNPVQASPLPALLAGGAHYSTPFGGQDQVKGKGRMYSFDDGDATQAEPEPGIANAAGHFLPQFPMAERLARPVERKLGMKPTDIFSPVTDQRDPQSFMQAVAQSLGLKTLTKSKDDLYIQKQLEKAGVRGTTKSELMRLIQLGSDEKATPQERKAALQDFQRKLADFNKFQEKGGGVTRD